MNPMFCRRAFGLVFVAGILLIHTSVYADTNAAVSGLVTDPQGHAVVDTAILLTNVNTGIAYQTKTNGEGIYRVNGLQPGIYRANVSKDGFKSIVKPTSNFMFRISCRSTLPSSWAPSRRPLL